MAEEIQFQNEDSVMLQKPSDYLQQQSKQDGPSLESSSYLNVNLRYLGLLDPGTHGPWDSWTSSLLQHFLELPLKSLKEVTIRDIFGGGEGHEFLKKA